MTRIIPKRITSRLVVFVTIAALLLIVLPAHAGQGQPVEYVI